MNSIQISDLNVSDFEFMHQLTDDELLAINGGFLGIDWLKNKGKKLVGKIVPVAEAIIDYLSKKDWRTDQPPDNKPNW